MSLSSLSLTLRFQQTTRLLQSIHQSLATCRRSTSDFHYPSKPQLGRFRTPYPSAPSPLTRAHTPARHRYVPSDWPAPRAIRRPALPLSKRPADIRHFESSSLPQRDPLTSWALDPNRHPGARTQAFFVSTHPSPQFGILPPSRTALRHYTVVTTTHLPVVVVVVPSLSFFHIHCICQPTHLAVPIHPHFVSTAHPRLGIDSISLVRWPSGPSNNIAILASFKSAAAFPASL